MSATEEVKTCACCKLEQPAANFSRASSKSYRLYSYCKPCVAIKSRASNKRHRAKDPIAFKEREWQRHIHKTFGLTYERYCEMLHEQDGVCAICGTHGQDYEARLSVDHDHATGEVRGLLCRQCNAGLGAFRDSLNMLEAAIGYLEVHKGGSFDVQNMRIANGEVRKS